MGKELEQSTIRRLFSLKLRKFTVKKHAKEAKSTKKHVIKLRKKKLKLEVDPSPANQIVEGASTEAGNNLRISKVKKLVKEAKSTKKKVIELRKKKLKLEEDTSPVNQASTEAGNILRISKEHKRNKVLKKKDKLVKKKKRRAENASNGGQNQDDTDGLDAINSGQLLRNGAVEDKKSSEIAEPFGVEEACRYEKDVKAKKVKKAGKRKRKSDLHVSEKDDKSLNPNKPDAEKVDEISSVDEDCSRGMKKWLIDYKDRRPGLKILQERIDEFITDYEAQQEQERKEREARAAEGGWTVVVHHKGRKKTTDAETGITVGSVAQAAVLDNMAKKKNKEVAIDFYRFQKREARRSEVMMLQSKFEQDKKRMQQLRAARKFRPY